jgi:hypothetical protein
MTDPSSPSHPPDSSRLRIEDVINLFRPTSAQETHGIARFIEAAWENAYLPVWRDDQLMLPHTARDHSVAIRYDPDGITYTVEIVAHGPEIVRVTSSRYVEGGGHVLTTPKSRWTFGRSRTEALAQWWKGADEHTPPPWKAGAGLATSEPAEPAPLSKPEAPEPESVAPKTMAKPKPKAKTHRPLGVLQQMLDVVIQTKFPNSKPENIGVPALKRATVACWPQLQKQFDYTRNIPNLHWMTLNAALKRARQNKKKR